MEDNERLWGKEQVAEFLGVSTRTVERLASSGGLPCFPLTKRCVRFSPTEVRAFLESLREGR